MDIILKHCKSKVPSNELMFSGVQNEVKYPSGSNLQYLLSIQASAIIFSILITAVGQDLIPMMLPLCDGVLCPLILRSDPSQWHLPVAVHQTAVLLDGEELQVSRTQELFKSTYCTEKQMSNYTWKDMIKWCRYFFKTESNTLSKICQAKSILTHS